MAEELCPCGEPLHYSDPRMQTWVQTQVETYGPTVDVRVVGVGAWRVPRHFIALHGFLGEEATLVASLYDFEEIE